MSLKSLFIFAGLIFVLCCKHRKNEVVQTIILTNNSEMKLFNKAISIERSTVGQSNNLDFYPLLIQKKDTIPAQVNDLDGDGKWDELFFVANFLAKEKKMVQLKWVKDLPHFPIKTSVRFGKRESKNEPVKPAMEETLLANQVHKKLGFQKYQTDGPTWENDKVGFRHYLDGRNAKDFFRKRTSAGINGIDNML